MTWSKQPPKPPPKMPATTSWVGEKPKMPESVAAVVAPKKKPKREVEPPAEPERIPELVEYARKQMALGAQRSEIDRPTPAKASRRTKDQESWPELIGLNFWDFVKEFLPHMSAPTHFAPFVDYLTKNDGKGLRCCMAAPIQHGKSTLVKMYIVWRFVNDPTLRIVYFCYGQDFAEEQTNDLREMIAAAGIRSKQGADNKKGMRFELGGSLVVSSVVGGRGVGFPIDVAIVDDPFKNPVEAYSKSHRDKVYDWYLYVLHGRVPANGTIIVIASRWDEDDLSGRLQARQGYDELHLPAISDSGEALCPWGPDPKNPRTLEWLKEVRFGNDGSNGKPITDGIGEHAWSAQFQGKPIPRDTAVFRGTPSVYTSPPVIVRRAIGVDLGFTEHTDHSAAVVLGADSAGQIYVLDVQRWQRRLEPVAVGMRALSRKYPGAQLFTYWSGAEIQAIRTLMDPPYNLDVVAWPARYHKSFRAERAAAAWSSGKIQIPAVASWNLSGFLSEVRNFTGADGDEDDRVDALVAAYDALEIESSQDLPGFHGRRCL